MTNKDVMLTSEEMENMAKEAITIWWCTVIKAVVLSNNSEPMKKILHQFLGSAVREMVTTYGSKKTLELMGPLMRQGGKKAGVSALGEHEIVERDGIAISSLIDLWEGALGVRGEIVEKTPSSVIKVAKECPFSDQSPELCTIFGQFVDGFCEVINPEFEWCQTHKMTSGDQECRWVCRKED
ncbi:MAG: L-2-amino-thiazoline-4-carboxylic acid hydrolase [Methanomassiliicoccales archaeon]|nr:L-2-amino-thiazoline-4-carboxylic acid hydrolase [Methanomassiliicoccales archaeon]TFG57015.1 MAG: hypothetical protein E4H30_01915 [Methanomassiliicoccus sp.]